MFKKKYGKCGFVTLEFIMVSVVLIPLLVSFIGIFIYSYPTFAIQREVDVLIRKTQQHGGVRSEDLDDFKGNLQKVNFINNSNKDIEVVANTNIGNQNAMNVTDSNYVSRKDNLIINLTIKVPSNSGLIKNFTNKYSEYYIYNINVVSEKY